MRTDGFPSEGVGALIVYDTAKGMVKPDITLFWILILVLILICPADNERGRYDRLHCAATQRSRHKR